MPPHCNIDCFLDGNEDKYVRCENYISESLKEKSRDEYQEEKDFKENPLKSLTWRTLSPLGWFVLSALVHVGGSSKNGTLCTLNILRIIEVKDYGVSDDVSLKYRKSSASRRTQRLEELKRLLRLTVLAMQDGPTSSEER